jgi:polysaccharide export outer membrane protein
MLRSLKVFKSRVRALVTATAGIGLALATFHAGAQTPQAQPPQMEQPESSEAPAQAAPAASAVDPQYVIGPGDTVQVFVWRNPELTVTVPVRPDGKISTPLVEDVIAVGKTSSQLAREVERVLGEYIRSPQVNIIVTNAASAYSQIKVIGEVASPQSVPYREGITAMDVVLAVGGLTAFAAGNRAKIIRRTEDGKPKEIKVKLESLLRKGKIAENQPMYPGDVLVVPQSFF